MKIRNVFNSAHFGTYTSANEARQRFHERKDRKIKAIKENGIVRALKITSYFTAAQSQWTMKIRNVFSSVHFGT